LLFGFICVWLHPRPKTPTPAFPESGMVIGSSIGCILSAETTMLIDFAAWLPKSGSWINLLQLFKITQHSLTFYLARFAIGMVVVAVVRIFGKFIFVPFVRRFLSKGDVNAEQAFVKFFTYGTIGWSIGIPVLILFHLLGLQDPGKDLVLYSSIFA